MKHVKTVSRTPGLAITDTTGRLSVAEQIVILGLSLFFGDWQNFSQVISNLEKYYRKTPD